MKKQKNILFVVPDGVGIRNYLYSSLISKIKDRRRIYFWTTLPDAAIEEVEKIHDVSIKHMRFSFHKESVRTRVYREASTYARLLWNAKRMENPTILSNWGKNKSNLKLKTLNILATSRGKKASKNYDDILALEKKAEKFVARSLINRYKNQLIEVNPEALFVTHQRVAFLNPICMAARELGIKVITCIYSWDNTPKASLAIRADTYLVWSDYMKKELSSLYPEIPKEDIVITGTPQFEFYFEEKRKETREKFAKTHNLDVSKKWICFSGDDPKTSPYDPLYLEDLAEAVSEIAEEIRPQLIFRRCPVDFSPRYDDVISAYPKIIKVIDPVWYSRAEGWGAVYPKQEDINMLVNVVEHCDLVVNLGSTMAHDFAVFDKPCLYINYDQQSDPNWSVDTIYKFQHFRSMGDLDVVGWLNNKEEIREKVMQALQEPKMVGKDRKAWMKVIVRHPLQENSNLIATQLLND